MDTSFANPPIHVADIVSSQRTFFQEGHTRSDEARQDTLRTLIRAVNAYQDRFLEAVHQDFRKPHNETIMEIGTVLDEARNAIKHIPSWTRARHVSMPLMLFPGSAKKVPEPLGVSLIIAPWNYPINLTLIPAIGAIAAGNTVIIKPSEFSPHSSQVLEDMVAEYFPEGWITVVQGEAQETQGLIEAPVDHVFFTGSSTVGKLVMASAAKNLIPVALELGGKSPAVIDGSASLDTAAKRILWSKCYNGGQTCVAADYVFVPNNRKQEFFENLKHHIHAFYGENPKESDDFSRIINERAFNRLTPMITGDIVAGGETDPKTNYIAPTIINVEDPASHPTMQEEIFGPIMPVIGYDHLDEVIDYINANPKPLACYLFSNSSRIQKRFLRETSSGALAFNDLILQASLPDLPFGGVGNSGMNGYHGKTSFEIFSHYKSVMKRSLLVDVPFLYPPYKISAPALKSLMKWFT